VCGGKLAVEGVVRATERLFNPAFAPMLGMDDGKTPAAAAERGDVRSPRLPRGSRGSTVSFERVTFMASRTTRRRARAPERHSSTRTRGEQTVAPERVADSPMIVVRRMRKASSE